MKLSQLTSIAALTLLVGAAHAQTIRIAIHDEVPLPISTVTRAEVIADYHIWRLSGLQALNQGDGTPNTESLQYRKAQAKYEWLRSSPQFAELVAEVSRRPDATVVESKSTNDALIFTAAAQSR